MFWRHELSRRHIVRDEAGRIVMVIKGSAADEHVRMAVASPQMLAALRAAHLVLGGFDAASAPALFNETRDKVAAAIAAATGAPATAAAPRAPDIDARPA